MLIKKILFIFVLCINIVYIANMFLFVSPSYSMNKPWDGGDHEGTDPDDGKDPETPCNPPCKPDCLSKGSPVYLVDGNFLHSTVDLIFPCRIPFSIKRSYNSRDNFRTGYFGYGWVFSYGYRLVEVEDEDSGAIIVYVLQPNGQRIEFVKENNSYLSPSLVYFTLTKKNGLFTLKSKDKKKYIFNSSGQLASIIDRNNNELSFTYTSSAMSSIKDYAGRKFIIDYGPNGKISCITDPLNRKYRYDYDIDGNLIKYINPMNGEVNYIYDNQHNLIQIIGSRNNQALSIHYDSKGKVQKYTDAKGKTWFYDYLSVEQTNKSDSNGNTWQYFFNEMGLITKEIDPLGGLILRTYYDDGNVKNISNINNNKISYSYDVFGNIVKITDPLGNEKAYTYHPIFNYMTSYTNSLNQKTIINYDSNGNKKKIISSSGHETLFQYAENGDLLSFTDPRGDSFFLEYDKYGNIIKSTDASGNNTMMEYDLAGNAIKITNAEGNVNKYKYDDLNRLVEYENAYSYKTTYKYDQSFNVNSIQDANGSKWEYGYDLYNNIKQITDPLNNTLSFTYNDGNLATFTDSNGNMISYEYDCLDHLVKIEYPDKTSELFEYSKDGNLTFKITRNNDKIIYTYDSLNRIISIAYPDNVNIIYTYDSINLKTIKGKNQIIKYEYDDQNRMLMSTQNSKTVRYEYDALGNMTKLVYPDNSYILYSYNEKNLLHKIIDMNGKILVEYTYDSLKRKKQMVFGNNIVASYIYDQIGRLIKLEYKNNLSKTLISSLLYTYDKSKNIMSIESLNGLKKFTYDKKYQVKSADYPNDSFFPDTIFNYDAGYNRTSIIQNNNNIINYATNVLNQYTKVNNHTFFYDNNANLINDGIKNYFYDYNNNLIKVQTKDTSVTFGYDLLERKNTRKHASSETSYVYDHLHVVAIYDNNDKLQKKFIYAPGIDKLVLMDDGTEQYYYHLDNLGSVFEISDSNGTIVEKYYYDAYGNSVIKDINNNIINRSKIDNPFLFTGREYDEVVSLYYFRSRWYDQTIGRFISPDPISHIFFNQKQNGNQWINLFSYTKNNPINYLDPLGLNPIQDLIEWSFDLDQCDCYNNCMRDVEEWDICENSNRPGDPRETICRKSKVVDKCEDLIRMAKCLAICPCLNNKNRNQPEPPQKEPLDTYDIPEKETTPRYEVECKFESYFPPRRVCKPKYYH